MALLTSSMMRYRIVERAELSTYKSSIIQELLHRQVDHLRWTDALGMWLANGGLASLNIESDAGKCALGRWFVAEHKKLLLDLFPELAKFIDKLGKPHADLHNSTHEIFDAVKSNNISEAKNIFNEKILKYSNDVVNLLDQAARALDASAKSDQEENRIISEKSFIFGIFIFILTIFLSVLIVLLLQRTVAEPLNKVVESAQRITNGDIEHTIHIYERGDEIGKLVDALNKMTESLKSKIREVRIQSDQALANALTDQLTGLPNFLGFLRVAERQVEDVPGAHAILYIDINNFKYINTTYGYAEGDAVLLQVADTLIGCTERYESVGKIAPDHFLLLMTSPTQASLEQRLHDAQALVSDIQKNLQLPFLVNLSVGIAFLTPGEALSAAIDRAHYAKDFERNSSRSTWNCYDGAMVARILEEKDIENIMASSLEAGEFIPYYQPKVDLHTGAIVGAEALVRWNRPGRGLMSPGAFVPVFERNGFIRHVDLHIIACVCQYIARQKKRGIFMPMISCNLSRIHFLNENMVSVIGEIVDKYGVPASSIELEITESVAVDNLDMILDKVHKLKERGFIIAIDDFGSGYSSLAMLSQLPIDVLKIDKGYFEESVRTDSGKLFLEAVVSVAHKIGISIVCEGIEKYEHIAYLSSIGLSIVQGYYFSKPVPEDIFSQFVHEGKITKNRL